MSKEEHDYYMARVKEYTLAKKEGLIEDFTWEITPEGLKLDLFFIPKKPLDYIKLNFVGNRSNVSYDEIINNC